MFADKVFARVHELECPAAVGLDPRVKSLPRFTYANRHAGLSDSASAVVEWAEAVIEAASGSVAVVKPQSAFYECLGDDGYRVLRRVIAAAHEAGLYVILDAKRSDIGSTAEAYALAGLDASLLDADAMTVMHYFGRDGVEPFLRYTRDHGRGLFVVVHSSNPSSVTTQDVAVSDGRRYFEAVAELVAEWGADSIGRLGYSSVGAVVGATFPGQLGELRAVHRALPFLVPGYGAQGGTGEDVADAFDAAGLGALVSASRSISDVSGEERTCARADYVELVRMRIQAMAEDLHPTRV